MGLPLVASISNLMGGAQYVCYALDDSVVLLRIVGVSRQCHQPHLIQHTHTHTPCPYPTHTQA